MVAMATPMALAGPVQPGRMVQVLISVVSRRHEGVILDLSQLAMLWQLGITTSYLTGHGELTIHVDCGASC